MSKLSKSLSVVILFASSLGSWGQDGKPVESVRMEGGELSVLFRDNSESPQRLSGIDSLFNIKHAPKFDAFDPDAVGASAGLNFEHIISGHKNSNNKFTPRRGPYNLYVEPDRKSAKLVRRAKDSPWQVDSELKYTIVEPNYVDFEFRCIPREASAFGQRGYALFFFANYMNDVADVALNFRGRIASDAPERWISAIAPKEHPDWNGGGNYRSVLADDLEYDEDVEFRLNTWSYDWPRISQPFYYGLADNEMTLILMFDRLHSLRDQIRFSLYKFKLPKHPRPAWDFQYVVNRVKSDEEYGFNARLVWKKFVSAEDCQQEYEQWTKSLRASSVRKLRQLDATVFTRNDSVVEVNANDTKITDKQLEWVSAFSEMTDLSLENTNVHDAGISHLSNLQKLEWLNLYRCPVGDAALRDIKHLKRLQHLPIGNSRVTDAGLLHVSEMSQLVYLGLRANNVTDQGIKQLQKLVNLTGLHLGETKVTDGGIAHLHNMNNLQQLWLDGTAITDGAIEHLARLQSLTELHVRGTKITENGIKQLQLALPRCEIDWGPAAALP